MAWNFGQRRFEPLLGREVFVLCARSGRRYSRHTLPYSAGLLAPALAERWVQLEADAATEDFLASCLERSVATTLLKGALARVLCWCLSKTDVNALLGRGEMFVLSATQALRLFAERPGGLLLDVGAGTGSCTMELAQLFDHVLTTEVSRPMVAQLRRRGLPVLEGGDLSGLEAMAAEVGIPLGPSGTFDCIALMNVLDRCIRPRSLLQELRRRLTPRGRLLIAVVLPFRPFVEHGIFRLAPEQKLPLSRDATFESAAEELWSKVLAPLGFHLEAFARVPYLCEGDLAANVYSLDDAVFLLSRAGDP